MFQIHQNCHLRWDKRMACAGFLQNRDNTDYCHIDRVTLNKVQAMELAKNVKRHNSQFCLCLRTLLASVQHDTTSKSGIDTHMGRMTRKQEPTITHNIGNCSPSPQVNLEKMQATRHLGEKNGSKCDGKSDTRTTHRPPEKEKGNTDVS